MRGTLAIRRAFNDNDAGLRCTAVTMSYRNGGAREAYTFVVHPNRKLVVEVEAGLPPQTIVNLALQAPELAGEIAGELAPIPAPVTPNG